LKAEIKKKIQKSERTILLSEVYEKYEEIKKQERKIDFDDMIFELQQAMRKDELLLRLLQEQFLYLLVDEHQDTNDSQNMLILMIAEFFDTPNVFIVGDEKQAIYRFQGASVENFLKFQKIWRDVKLIQLETSYRTHQEILDASFNLIEHNYEEGEHQDLRVPLKTGNGREGESIVSVVGKNITDSEEYLVVRLKEILEKEKDSDIALIVRTNAAVSRLKRLCESRGLEASAVRNIDIFSHPTGRLFFDLLSSIFNPLDVGSIGRTVVAGLWDLSFEEQIDTLKKLKSRNNLKDISIAKKIKTLHDSIFSGDPLGFLFEIATASGYVKKISSESERVEVWRGIIDFSENVLRGQKNFSDTFALVEELLAFKDLAEQKSIKVASGDPDTRIKIMTAHGSKGLEFDYVFAMYATESFWMKKSFASFFNLPFERISREDDVKDSRRLFYVALTRAKKHVEILSHQEKEGGEIDLSLRFIEELGQNNIVVKNIGKTKKPAPIKFKSKQSKLRAGYLEVTKRALVENGLSVTALNHFLECPNKFIYKSVLRIPELPNASSEKGNAMHTALAYFFRSNNKVENAEKIIKKKAFEYIDNSLIEVFEKENLKKILEEEIPLMVKGLEVHLKIEGKINIEKSASGELEFIVKTKKVKVPIHGRLDLLVENPNLVEVFDYKTKKPMSDAEIRGETKNSDGGYFRQLVFYSLLVSMDPKLKSKPITSALVFLTPDQKGRIKISNLEVKREDVESIKSDIKNLTESIYSGQILDAKCEDAKCQWCSLREILDF